MRKIFGKGKVTSPCQEQNKREERNQQQIRKKSHKVGRRTRSLDRQMRAIESLVAKERARVVRLPSLFFFSFFFFYPPRDQKAKANTSSRSLGCFNIS